MLPRQILFPLVTILAYLAATGTALSQTVPTPAEVQAGIDRAVGYLLSTQGGDGGWAEVQPYRRGASSLVVLALINAGIDPQSPAMIRALNFISDSELDKTYSVSLQTMALCAANPNRYAAQIQRNVDWLIKAQSDDGGWSYGEALRLLSDPSNSQFALLALHEAQRIGISDSEADSFKKCMDKARSYWINLQNRDGSFVYSSGMPPSGSMTAAGIASLIIVGSQSDHLQANAKDSVNCCGNEDTGQQRIEMGLNWLGQNFNVMANPGGSNQTYMYYMYALERVGRLAGRRYFVDRRGAQIDWYREGALALIRRQRESGGFGTSSHGNEATEVAFGLLFLAKGKRQIVINRLHYGNSLDWNLHPMAVQHLTTYTEQAWKRDLAWQTVRLSAARLEDLLEAPVLFISGSKAPNFSADEKRLLKQYVEQGGFIFAEACNGDGCQGIEFERYFQNLVVELFGSNLEKLPPDHPIWYAQTLVDPKALPKGAWLYGVQTCCRLGVIYSPYSLSCRWELNLPYGNRPNYASAVQNELDTATAIGINVLTYASGKELKERLDSVSVLEEVVQRTSTDRGIFHLPVLSHNAGADDAPRAVKTLVEWLNQESPFLMSSEKRLVPIESTELQRYPLVYIHGRGKLELSDRQREALRRHVSNGGFLIASSICADQQFSDSFRREMEIVLGQGLVQLDSGHALFSTQYNGFDIRQLTIIDPMRGGKGEMVATTRRVPPAIEAGFIGGRMVVAFSPLDISCALESRHSLQCRGYLREDAARLGINLILYALQQQ
jgi:hypothetical protein